MRLGRRSVKAADLKTEIRATGYFHTRLELYNDHMEVHKRIALLGCGRLGEAFLEGLLASRRVPPEKIRVNVRTGSRAADLSQRHSLPVTHDRNPEAVVHSDVVLLAVKPGVVREVVREISPHLRTDQILISMAAAVPLRLIESHLSLPMPVFRAMPNIAMSMRESATALCCNRLATQQHRAVIEGIFQSVGTVHFVEEAAMHGATALSGCGPAYAFLIAQALASAGAEQGVPANVARSLAAQTLLGAASVLKASTLSPAELVEQVATPGGATEEGLQALERHNVRSGLSAAVEAAARPVGMADK